MAELELSVHSNQNFLISGEVDADTKESTEKRITVNKLALDDYLDDIGVDLENIDVLRMDVQGAKYEVLKETQSLPNNDRNLIFP